jgi:hypothetical protein
VAFKLRVGGFAGVASVAVEGLEARAQAVARAFGAVEAARAAALRVLNAGGPAGEVARAGGTVLYDMRGWWRGGWLGVTELRVRAVGVSRATDRQARGEIRLVSVRQAGFIGVAGCCAGLAERAASLVDTVAVGTPGALEEIAALAQREAVGVGWVAAHGAANREAGLVLGGAAIEGIGGEVTGRVGRWGAAVVDAGVL